MEDERNGDNSNGTVLMRTEFIDDLLTKKVYEMVVRHASAGLQLLTGVQKKCVWRDNDAFCAPFDNTGNINLLHFVRNSDKDQHGFTAVLERNLMSLGLEMCFQINYQADP